MAGGSIEAALEAATRKYLSATGIADLKRLSAGASQETWSFDAPTAEGIQQLILRRAPGGVPEARSTAIGQVREARLIQIAYAHGVKAPRVRYVLAPEDGLGVGFVMDRVAGRDAGAAYPARRPLCRGAAQAGGTGRRGGGPRSTTFP